MANATQVAAKDLKRGERIVILLADDNGHREYEVVDNERVHRLSLKPVGSRDGNVTVMHFGARAQIDVLDDGES